MRNSYPFSAKNFQFYAKLSKAAKFKSLLLVDTRFLGAAHRAFASLSGLIVPIFIPAACVSDDQLIVQRPPLFKARQGQFRQFLKAFSNSKIFGTK
jgi:hypothetical protein